MLDIGFIGQPWTWCNNWEQGGLIKQRLDRGLSTHSWSQVFEKVQCSHITSFASDHSILLFDTMMNHNRKKQRFYFDKRWLQKDDIRDVIRTTWEKEVEGSRMFQVVRKVKNCRLDLLKWRNSFQANSRKAIEQLENEISELQQSKGASSKGSKESLKKIAPEYI